MSHIEELKEVIQKLHGADAMHRESVPVKDVFNGQTIWDGVGEVFDLHGHPTAKMVYAWSHETDEPENPKRHVTVLHGGKITSALDAEKAAIVQEFGVFREMETLIQPKQKKVGRPKLPKGEAKGRIVPVRFNPDEIKRITASAKASNKTISEWIRSTLNVAIQS